MSELLPDNVDRLLRREFLFRSGLGLGSIALGSLIDVDRTRAAAPERAAFNPLALKPTHFPPKAKAVIQLFMAGGPSQLELFDYKPKLQELSGRIVPKSYVEGKRFLFIKPDSKLLGTQRKFSRHGQAGVDVSELMPHFKNIVDDVALIRTMKTDNFSHGAAKLLTQTGYPRFGFPTMGAWLLYGLGSVSQNLPGYVVLQSGPRGPRGGSYLWSNGFLPAAYQGVPLRGKGEPILNLTNPAGITPDRQQRTIEAVAALNRIRLEQTLDDETAARTANYEMAFRMQHSAPELMDIAEETQATLDLYGVKPGQASFAMNCLLARRLVERGVRFVTIFHTDWDHHGGNENLEGHLDTICRETDQPSAALVKDLKQRGLLDDTLVVWGGEFGRTPMGEVRATVGRDHHIDTYCTWLAGGGVRGGQVIGETDELGFAPTETADTVHIHDLQATILHLLGLDHLKLTYRFQGRDFRLTDVEGNVVKRLLV
jgi:uncharacterized protein (DUF1501 family)